MTTKAKQTTEQKPLEWTNDEKRLIAAAIVNLPIAMASPQFKTAQSIINKLRDTDTEGKEVTE